jgi:hypothetical protein
VDLLQLVVALQDLAAAEAGGLGCLARVGGQVAEGGLRQLDEALVLHLAGGGDDQPGGAVVAAHVVEEGRARHRGHDLLRAQDRAAERLVGVGRLLEEVAHEVVGRVADLPDLLQDDLALLLQLALVEGRALEDVGDQVEAERQVGGQDAGVVGGVLAGGVGVERAADGLDLLGDGAGGAGRRCP